MSVDSFDRIGIVNHWVEDSRPTEPCRVVKFWLSQMLKHLSPQTLSNHYFETGCLLLDQLPSRIGPKGGVASRPSRASVRLSGIRAKVSSRRPSFQRGGGGCSKRPSVATQIGEHSLLKTKHLGIPRPGRTVSCSGSVMNFVAQPQANAGFLAAARAPGFTLKQANSCHQEKETNTSRSKDRVSRYKGQTAARRSAENREARDFTMLPCSFEPRSRLF